MTPAPDEVAGPLRQAWDGMGRVLDARPAKDDLTLSDVTKALCTARDAVIAGHRETPLDAEGRGRLERLNAVLGQVFGMHFPMGPVPWDEFATSRDWLADLLREFGAGVGAAAPTLA